MKRISGIFCILVALFLSQITFAKTEKAFAAHTAAKQNKDLASFAIGGTVAGLVGTVVLQNNGSDNLTINTNGSFTFATKLAQGSTYNITVLTEPRAQTCTISNGSGTIFGPVTNVNITCTTNFYSVGGAVSGLNGTVVLQNNADADGRLTISANGSFTFASKLSQGSAYNVTVAYQPTNQSCRVSNGSGTLKANVTNVTVTCVSNIFSIGGMIAGLNGTVVLLNNGDTDNALTTTANGSFKFSEKLAQGSIYNVTVATQPATQTCRVSNGSGKVNGNITNVYVVCTDNTYTIGGTVTGLIAGTTMDLQNNGDDTLLINENGNFTFAAQIASNGSYNVTVAANPTGETCSIVNGTGVVSDTDITNITVDCTHVSTIYAGGFDGNVYYTINSGQSWAAAATQPAFDFPVTSVFVTSSTLYAASENGQVYYSQDGGSHWTASAATPDNSAINSVHVTDTRIYVGTQAGNVYFSYNNGRNWTATSNQPSPTFAVTSVFVNAGKTALYAGCADGYVYYTTSTSGTWTKSSAIDGSAIHNIFATTDTLYANTADQYVYTSSTLNGSGTWSTYGQSVYSLFVNADASIIYAGTSDGYVYAITPGNEISFVANTAINSVFYAP